MLKFKEFSDFMLNESYGFQLMDDAEISKIEDVNVLYQFIKNYVQQKGLNIPQPITVSKKGDVKIIRSLDTADFKLSLNKEFRFTPTNNQSRIKIGKGFNVSFGNGTRTKGGILKGPEFEDHIVSDLQKWIELGDDGYKLMYNPKIVQEFIEKSQFSTYINLKIEDVQKVGGENNPRPLLFSGKQPYIGTLNFKAAGKILSDVTVNNISNPFYISCKTTSTVSFFNAGIKKLITPDMIDSGKYSAEGLTLFEALGIDAEKFSKTFRFRKKLNTVVTELEELDNATRASLGIDSADPIYQDEKIRKRWISEIKAGVEKIGAAEIKSKWSKILSTLSNDGYTILRIFLDLSFKIDPKAVSTFQNRIEISKGPVSKDADAFKDFLNTNIDQSEEKFSEKIEVNIDTSTLSTFIKSGIGSNYWLIHKDYKPGKNSVKYVDDTFLEEASKIEGPITIFYGGKTGNATRVDIEFRTAKFLFKINLRDKQGVSGYPSHIMMDYQYL